MVRSGFHKQDRIDEIENLDLIRLNYCAMLARTRLSNEQAVSFADDHPLLTSLEQSGCHLLRNAPRFGRWRAARLASQHSRTYTQTCGYVFYALRSILLFIVFV